jgi:hypothetical protein
MTPIAAATSTPANMKNSTLTNGMQYPALHRPLRQRPQLPGIP